MFNRSGDSAVDPELEEDAVRWQTQTQTLASAGTREEGPRPVSMDEAGGWRRNWASG